jgi:hypothetical protein
LRWKLQKGLLNPNQAPKEGEMEQMSDFVSKLESYKDLEVGIIRATKIKKVLKAILKLNSIPKEEDFKFQSRSRTLLSHWKKLGRAAGAAMDTANNQSSPVGMANDAPTINAAVSPNEATAIESAMVADNKDTPVDVRADQTSVKGADDQATIEIEDENIDGEIPDYIQSFFPGLEDKEGSDYASGDNPTSNNVTLRNFRLRNRLDRHHQQRDLHVEYVTSILDRVSAQVHGRDGELHIVGDSLKDFLLSELDATSVTTGVLDWVIKKAIAKYKAQLYHSLRKVREE